MKKAVGLVPNVATFMILISNFGARVKALEVGKNLIMSKNNDKVYYAVGRGRQIGIFDSWSECKDHVQGFENPKFRKFHSLEEAEEFVNFWKNYVSPSKETNTVVSNFSNGERLNSERTPHKMRSFKIPPLLPEKNEREQDYEYKAGDGYKAYVSPLPCKVPPKYISSKNKKSVREFKNESSSSSGIDNITRTENQSVLGRFSCVDAIDKPKTSFQFDAAINYSPSQDSSSLFNNTSEYDTSSLNIFPKCDSTSENIYSEKQSSQVIAGDVTRVKKEVVEVETETSDELNEESETLTSFIESAINIINKEDKAERLKSCLKLLIKRMYTSTNSPVNPQMEPEESCTKNCEDSVTQSTPPPASTSCHASLAPPSPHSTSLDQKNADILALNLRLDSFEKRFDACLKEVGGIVSELSYIKSEIKEIKESLSGGTPKKGMRQTTLNFSPSKNKAEGTSSSYYSSKKGCNESEHSGEPAAKRSRPLKRRASNSNVSNNSEDEGDDYEFLNKIKKETVDYTSFTVDSDEFVEVYTDGACRKNGKNAAKAGIGIWFGDNHPLNVSAPVEGPPTNNSAEIQAARVAVELAINAGISKLKILTDSEFLINCATKWIHRWKSNGWVLVDGGPVKNRKELEKLDKASSKITVRWEKVEAHTGIKGNEMADRLATQGASKYNR